MQSIQRALISVSDKTGIVEFARTLAQHKIEILSTGGTAKLLKEHGLAVIDVSDYTGFPELFAGRLKTLHPKVHGGILARRGMDDEAMQANHIPAIDLVIVNLYPFQDAIAKDDCTLAQAIENIDIGGPTMVRAAAKNHQSVSIVVHPEDYARVTDALNNEAGITERLRFELAVKAFEHTAQYDAAISCYLYKQCHDSDFPETLTLAFEKSGELRYGENPHQQAAVYKESNHTGISVVNAELLQGKALSYNNLADADAALACVKSFKECSCVIVKHANPCGVAHGKTVMDAYQRAFACDSTSAFGGIIAFNQSLTKEVAQTILANQFAEVIIAPYVDKDALEILSSKPNLRVLATGEGELQMGFDLKRIAGGLLIQEQDRLSNEFDYEVVTKRKPNEEELASLSFAWHVVAAVKSNAIVYAKNSQSIGIGAGQMSRIDSAKIAAIKAQEMGFSLDNAVMASDAFFPFRDSIDAAAKQRITAIVQPGGSIRDEEVIAACNEHDIAMIFTGERHFKH
ncbi:Bifunctional purine biosynthesis protein PurH [Piscirickettsia salmonis]|uniref:Bifunctional purine biosynthesis protein PurH n=1 Tax=Piscirickettsia salmonis TaxID=1238 RepID=A0A1L6TGD2_PISSA|nr:bifunctional phosphoribosylaminoimidazolecarboxamide formyltransferase/IMP cyclohydrolase [Piscirickettsia salmonis]AKP74673.1 bifunctional phosphoribosylaminoimidazolecarboxamide formyltransferase/inosine monophosphate cyclohydrolase [Piscirickettsia salmonis LF-89 = ATCC VR-1361]ALB21410.1 IMP cyclohydrolase [Piscirickettsia salmonis]ALY01642.1 bifunctional phosphoribosylaminoimidazolecarboxamide formyltransferase/inosine monophosphate cyclohydrolase [Piscirickettsia salmonis]AMA41154.1 bi